MDLYPPTPNLDVLLGRPVTVQMMSAAGGLHGLAALNGMKIRTLGLNARKAEIAAASNTNATGDGALLALAKAGEKVVSGYIIEATFLGSLFEGDTVSAVGSEPAVVKKAVDVLANKCALAARTDLGGLKRDGGYGKELCDDIRAAVDTARDKGKVDAGHVKALVAVETREDRAKRGGRQARNTEKRDRIEEEESVDAVTLVLERYLATSSMEDLGLSRAEREERLLRSDEVRSAIALEEARRERRKELRTEQQKQRNDMATQGSSGYEAVFFRSSGYLDRAFGVCVPRFETGGEFYAKLAAVEL